MKKIIYAVILLFVAVGCASSIYTTSMDEQVGLTWQPYEYSRQEVFEIVFTRVQAGNAAILTANEKLGIISTDWIEDSGILSKALLGGQRARMNFNVLENPSDSMKSVLKVNLSYQTRSGAFGRWEEQPVTKKNAQDLIAPMFESIKQDLVTTYGER